MRVNSQLRPVPLHLLLQKPSSSLLLLSVVQPFTASAIGHQISAAAPRTPLCKLPLCRSPLGRTPLCRSQLCKYRADEGSTTTRGLKHVYHHVAHQPESQRLASSAPYSNLLPLIPPILPMCPVSICCCSALDTSQRTFCPTSMYSLPMR